MSSSADRGRRAGRPAHCAAFSASKCDGGQPSLLDTSESGRDSRVQSREEHGVGVSTDTIGWIGMGRMGSAMATRLVHHGCDVAVYNRTRSKVEPLVAAGATAVETVAELSTRRIVFISVASSEDLLAVLEGPDALLSQQSAPAIIVDCSTVSVEASAKARSLAAKRSTALLAAPVSGNAKVVKAGRLTMAVSGPLGAFEEVESYLGLMGTGATYVGEGEVARLVKLCHNLMLGVVTQSLVEITVLAEKGGVRRQDFLAFLNDSVMGSTFTRYKSPALVNLDFTPTFTTHLLRKDLDLGLAAARSHGVPMPVAALVQQLVGAAVGEGLGDTDFAALIELEARSAGLELKSENAEVPDGLS
ncbi:MAG: NAD(P)-dependent oxidoreductase [Acidimicrobiales bacterium]